MGKSPLILAALAQAAVPASKFTQVTPLSRDGSGPYDSILLTLETGDHLVAKVARSAKADADLVTEVRALDALTNAYRARLPFQVARRLAEMPTGDGRHIYVFDFIYGSAVSINHVAAESPLASSLGEALAAIHNLPLNLVQATGLAEFTAAEIQRQRIAELDRALATSKIPPLLAQRWDEALEDVSLFRFQPCVIQGSFNDGSVLMNETEVVGVLNWSHIQIGDPADDLNWICASNNPELIDSVRATYSAQRSGLDKGLWRRAQLYSEFEIVRWLLHGVSINDAETVADAEDMLAALVAEVEAGTAPELVDNPEPVFAAAAAQVVETTATGEVRVIEEDVVVTLAAPDTEPVILPSGEPTEPVATVTAALTVESDSDVTEPIEVVDDKTRPIELPPKGDNELF
ncbi:MAG: hypothetical protein RLZZ626_1103 [Actinomycetota bacterium]